MGEKYDFSGWATRNDLKCSDGRVIRRDAFKECDGKRVPIVWSHIHDDPDLVLGHADLTNVAEGVRIDGVFNDSPKAQQTKRLIKHGDVVGLSIWANQLKQHGSDVLHGVIREVSIVLAGANPGAYIDDIMVHGDLEDEAGQAWIKLVGEEFFHSDLEDAEYLSHADDDDEDKTEVSKGDKKMADKKNVNQDDDETVEEVFNTLTDKQKTVVYALIGEALKDAGIEDDEDDEEDEDGDDDGDAISHADDDDETVEEVFNTLTDKQKTVVYALIGEALKDTDTEDEDEEDEEDYDEEDEEDSEMKHNVFENDVYAPQDYLSHEDMEELMRDAKRLGSLREAVAENLEEGGILAHAVYNTNDDGTQGDQQTYGMANVRYMFPDARPVNVTPEFIARDDAWVSVVLNGTHHTPFSRVKSVFADITMDEARAKGYIKGNQKVNEVFTLLKRETAPQTIYKLQKMDRDDVIDITDFDVIAWLKAEMRKMLNEEIARAILIGDGRLTSAADHIKHDCIRPIVSDASVYTITANVTTGKDDEETAKNAIKAAIRARKDYKGTGTPTMFTSESWLTEMMLLEDTLGHPLYADEAALARRMRVSRIVPVPVMDNFTIDGKKIYAIIVNLADYNIGADKGGEINMFDDFDIDFNQQKYLIETRISGALVRPYSAIVLKEAGE